MGSVGRGTVVPELQRAHGIEARALLDRFNLLKPLVEQMVISEAIARVVVSEDRAACMSADISIDSFPSSDFGVLRGKVTRIGSDALEPDPQQQRQELSFPVTIQLNDQQLKLKTGSSLPLKVGMSLTANIKLRKVSYLQLLLGEFQDKAESLQRL